MKILLIFTFYLISGAVRCFDVAGYSGGSVIIDSRKRWSSHPKYLRKQHQGSWKMIINYKTHDQWINEGRFSLYRNSDGNLMVFIRELNPQDSGKYQLGTSHTEFIVMNLDVKQDSCSNMSKSVTKNIGKTAILRCEYSHQHKYHIKTIFKEGKDSVDEIISTNDTWSNKRGISIFDDKHKNLFSVTITDVSPDDAGVYLCGVWDNKHSFSYTIITTVHLHIMNKVGLKSVAGYSGGQIFIKCEDPQYKTNPKYICKESAEGCSERKYPGVQNEWMVNGDVSLYDDTSGGVLMVFFRELNAGDAGTYRCGVNVSQYTERVTEVKLQVKDDALLEQRIIKSSYLGEEVNITCQIANEYKSIPTHFCKDGGDHICQPVSSSKLIQMNNHFRRNKAGVLTVTISNLTVRDAGVYWCGAETSEERFSFISLTTKVQLNLIMPPLIGHEGESAEIICPYDPIYKSNSKYLRKGTCSTIDRNTLIETVRGEKENKTDRFTLNDDITASVFTVTITGLTAEDAGKYCCAVTLERDVNYLSTDLIIIMKDELIMTGFEGGEISINCKHHHEHQKSFCKGHQPSVCVKDGVSLERIRDDRFSLSDEASTGVLTVNITDLREEDSGIYWCGSHIITKVHLEVKHGVSGKIIACLCVTLVLMGGLVLLLYKLGCIKSQDSKDANTLTDRTKMRSEEAPHAACEYENVKEIRQRSDAEETLLYSTVKLSTSSCELHNMLYATVQLPTNPSDLDCPLYSTAQLPTNPSDELLYAAVSFQKHEDSLTDDTVTFSKEEFNTEYASVNQCTKYCK